MKRLEHKFRSKKLQSSFDFFYTFSLFPIFNMQNRLAIALIFLGETLDSIPEYLLIIAKFSLLLLLVSLTNSSSQVILSLGFYFNNFMRRVKVSFEISLESKSLNLLALIDLMRSFTLLSLNGVTPNSIS